MTEQTKKRPADIGDVAELRAYARLLKMRYGDQLDVEGAREIMREQLEYDLPDELIDVLAMCCDPDFIEAMTTRAVADFHAKGEL